jgi:hypothetical protein
MGLGKSQVLAVGLVLLGFGTACPEMHQRGGRLDQAAHRDAVEQTLIKRCPPPAYQEFCTDGREQTPECIEACE